MYYILTFIKSNSVFVSSTITIIGILSFIVRKLYEKHTDQKQKEKNAVDDLMKLFNDSKWTFYPIKHKSREKVMVVHPLTHLFKSTSIKSSTSRIRTYESYFIRGLICNYANVTDDLMYRGAVEFDIANRDAILKVFERGDLPKTFLKMRSIFYTEFQPHSNCMNMDCIYNSLNDVLLDWKRIIIKYDKTLIQRYPWLMRQPYI